MKKIVLFFTLMLGLNSLLLAEDFAQKDLFQKAVDLYELEDYVGATLNYEMLIREGVSNSTIYYNLAVSYLKDRDIGKASLNVERALRLSPRDKNIRELKDHISKLTKEPQQNIAERTISKLKLIASLNELTMFSMALFFAVCLFFSLYCFLYHKLFLRLSLTFFLLLLLVIPLLYMKVEDELVFKEAVVVNAVPVRNKPIKTESYSFEIAAGRKVIILSGLGRWINVKLSVDGLSGWIDKNSLELI